MQTCCLVFEFIYFFANWTCQLTCTSSLPVCENCTIHHVTFVLALHNAENVPLSENIVFVRTSFTRIPPPLSKDTDSWLTGVGHYTSRLAINLLRNTIKYSQNVKNKKCISVYFAYLSFAFHTILHQSDILAKHQRVL